MKYITLAIRILTSPFAAIIGVLMSMILSGFTLMMILSGIGCFLVNKIDDSKEGFVLAFYLLSFPIAIPVLWIKGELFSEN